MSIFEDVNKQIIDEQYIQALKCDGIKVEEGMIKKAKQGKAEAIHTIGCAYVAIKNKEMALKWLGTSSAMGFGESQIEIGCLYKSFGDTKDNYHKAKEWFRTASENKVKSAYAHEGDIYFERRYFEKTLELFKKSADLGDSYGQIRLGELYLKNRTSWGHSVIIQDYALSMNFFRKAAEQGSLKAQYNIAQLYENGHGVSVNKYEALKWYMKSSSGGYEPATECINKLNEQGYFHVPIQEDLAKDVYQNNANQKDDKGPPTYNETILMENKEEDKRIADQHYLKQEKEISELKAELKAVKRTLEKRDNSIHKLLLDRINVNKK